jgi:hypothetical protein
MLRHGTVHHYRDKAHQCRCEACREAASEKRERTRYRRKVRAGKIPPAPPQKAVPIAPAMRRPVISMLPDSEPVIDYEPDPDPDYVTRMVNEMAEQWGMPWRLPVDAPASSPRENPAPPEGVFMTPASPSRQKSGISFYPCSCGNTQPFFRADRVWQCGKCASLLEIRKPSRR